MSIALDLRIKDAGWTDEMEDPETVCQRALKAALALTGIEGEVALLLTDDNEMHTLNRDWRGKDKPTDVLSFPADEMDAPFLGDIAVGLGVSRGDAVTRGIKLTDHLSHLVIHGYLHLLGYDHMSEEEAREMEALEIKALSGLGIGDPYGRDL
ncbi:rRNA maturation RNase YbeY [Henriciella barbarensis]|uniref:Endoribonuclease YbeY n=2 Tax=Henriciella barbarensis TaxID=86342 RepID=A0A399QY22_9PROT|nr:rRNA maturation RNase YbeY [Henriciella barbarensis]RIJ23840.1 rRNA maturation RNase YbeY [Henriciella barbarensis]